MVARTAGVTVALVTVLVVGSACVPLNEDEQHVFNRTNEIRRDDGVNALGSKDELVHRARHWAQELARRQTLQHSDLSTVEPGWRKVGENVGRGQTAEEIVRALAASPTHRANMVDRAFVRTGVGTARGEDGQLYVVQVFWRGCGADGEEHCPR